uniref:Uncharacterized protein n=1 Tax=Panagrolaimus sp. ES5 TaxID=591445 RepID=A0AC34G7Z5_9BILA
MFMQSERQATAPPECVPEYPELDEDDKNPLGPAFTISEVYEALKKCSNCAPGPDSITYATIKKFNPTGAILTAVFNAVKRLKQIPQARNTSQTILIFKKGDLAVSKIGDHLLSQTLSANFILQQLQKEFDVGQSETKSSPNLKKVLCHSKDALNMPLKFNLLSNMQKETEKKQLLPGWTSTMPLEIFHTNHSSKHMKWQAFLLNQSMK